MAKAAAKAKPEGGSGSSLVWVQGLACGGMAALAPLAMAQVAALLAPALAALMMDKRPGKPVARVMLLFALAASVQPIRVAWATGVGPTLDRVLDPSNLSIQLDTLVKAASAVGRTVEIRLKRDSKRSRATSA